MPDYAVHKDAYDTVNASVFIIGPGRTGSTLTGRIVQSFRGIEYAYEPPLLHTLVPMVASLPEARFRSLFETYLYEVLMMDMVTGRGWNFNQKDESSILKVKSPAEIEERTGVSMGKKMAMEKARGAALAFKLTDVVPFVNGLKALYPGMRFVLTHREAPGCIASLLKKEWFSDATLKSVGLVWNGRFENGLLHPHWLPATARPRWAAMSETGRCALYYRTMYAAIEGVPGLYVFSYDALIKDPGETIRALADWIGVGVTGNTERIIASVRDNSVADASILDSLPPAEREETLWYSDLTHIAELMRGK